MHGGGAQGWEIASTIATFLGVTAALAIALWSTLERRREERSARLAEARMFRVRGTGGGEREPTHSDPNPHTFHWYVEHHGTYPVFDVTYEAWPAGASIREPATIAITRETASPGEMLDQTATAPSVNGQFTLAAWRVRWRDRFGQEWAADSLNQSTPDRYTGQAPRPYPS